MNVIIDYDMGNIRSVKNAVARCGAEYIISGDKDVVARADRVIIPGVGNCAEAMLHLKDRGLTDTIRNLRVPVLGICVGMQVMCRHSEEGDVECLGIFDSFVKKFKPHPDAKVPHMGWNNINNLEKALFKGVCSGEMVYYVHSYYAGLCCDTIATTKHGLMFSAALKYENFYGTQFHPEKSGDTGHRILDNFFKL